MELNSPIVVSKKYSGRNLGKLTRQPSYQVAQVALWELDKKSGRGRM